MEQVVTWTALVELIAPHYPEGKTGRPPSAQVQEHRNQLSQVASAAKAGISERSARRIEQAPSLPSQ